MENIITYANSNTPVDLIKFN